MKFKPIKTRTFYLKSEGFSNNYYGFVFSDDIKEWTGEKRRNSRKSIQAEYQELGRRKRLHTKAQRIMQLKHGSV